MSGHVMSGRVMSGQMSGACNEGCVAYLLLRGVGGTVE